MWRERHRPPPLINARRPRMTLVQMILVIVFFAYCVPFLLVFGVPAAGAALTALYSISIR